LMCNESEPCCRTAKACERRSRVCRMLLWCELLACCHSAGAAKARQPARGRVRIGCGMLSFQPIISRMRDIVEPPGDLRSDWLKAHDWVVVPVESAKHFKESDAEALARAAKGAGSSQCFAVLTEELQNLPVCYEVTLSTTGLMQFSRESGSFCYALFP